MQEISSSENKLQCLKSNPAYLFCCESACSLNAIMCSDSKCSCQQTSHEDCKFSCRVEKIVSKVISKKWQKSEKITQLIKVLEEAYDQIIEQVSIEKEKTLQAYQNYGLKQSEAELITIISESRGQSITGKFIHNVLIELDSKEKIPSLESIDFEKLKSALQTAKDYIYSLTQKLPGMVKTAIYNSQTFPFESKIVTSTQDKQRLIGFFTKPIKSLRLLFRASESEYLTKNFREKCNGVPNTLTLIQTEANKVIGGFTPLAWQNPISGTYQADESQQTFIFSVTLDQKYPCTNYSKAVYSGPPYGPLFGPGGADICIVDKCKENQCNFAFPYCYNNGNIPKNNQEIWKLFSGAVKGSRIKVNQWEVFQLN